jgi:hypothetical protein
LRHLSQVHLEIAIVDLMAAQAKPTPQARPARAFFTVIALAAMLGHPASVQSAQRPAPVCKPAGPLVRVPGLPEGSGVAVSRGTPRRAYAHNDSGPPVLVALDDKGEVAGQLQLTGARVEDWEAVATGPCATGWCLYVGDIGDNEAERVTIYRVPEPAAAVTSTGRDVFHATYPDGAHDAETLLVTPKGDIYIVTKGDTGPVALYRFPRDIQNGATVELERIGEPRDKGRAGENDRITDGAVSPSGTWVALRTNHDVRFYQASDLLGGHWREAGRVNLTSLSEPQGEAIAFADDQTLYLVGEGGGKSQPGTFARLTCTF